MSQILNNLRPHAFKSRPVLKALFRHDLYLPKITIIPSRTKYYHNRHRDPKYRTERGRKLWPVKLPDFDQMRKDDATESPDEIRSRFKEKGIAPPLPYSEREIYTPSTITLIEPYKPPAGDGKSSSLLDKVKSGGKYLIKDRRELSAIRTYEGEDFDLKEFAKQSTDIYVKAHEALASKDESKVFDYVTEYCFPIMTAGLRHHTIDWKLLGEIEPPEVVQVRNGDLLSKGNKYSQITVRMHTKQKLAIYDRHGRLVHGSPTEVKEVLEYIVFEKYLANEYGLWRIHARIRPEEEGESFSHQVSKTFVVKNVN